MKAKLSKKLLADAQSKVETGKRTDIYDSEENGLFARVSPKSIGFFIWYRTNEGKLRRMRIGSLDRMSVKAAREQAKVKLAEVVKGGDPTAERRQARGTPTVRELAQRYLEEHVTEHLKPRTVESYRALAERYLGVEGRPAHPAAKMLAGLRVDALNKSKVGAWHRRIAKGADGKKGPQGAANRALALLSAVLNYAAALDEGIPVPSPNPCRAVTKYKEQPRENFLSPEQRASLMATLDAAEKGPLGGGRGRAYGKGKVDALRFVSLVGWRNTEVRELRWGMVDLETRMADLADTKTGRSIRPLSQQAAALLQGLRPPNPAADDLVFKNEVGGMLSIYGLNRAWRTIRKHAGIPEFWIHDMRHSHVSDAIMAGVPLRIAGQNVGHKRPQSTERYAHIANQAALEAADRAGDAIQRNTKKGRKLAGGDS